MKEPPISSNTSAPTFTTRELATCVDGDIDGPADLSITGINTLDDAKPGDITFISHDKYARRWVDSRASAAVVTRGIVVTDHNSGERALIHVDNAELACAQLLERFAPVAETPDIGVHPAAVVDRTARVADSARIGPHAVIGPACTIGEHVIIYAGVVLYEHVTIGDHCVLHSNTVLRERTSVGRRVTLHPGVTIGADGFGYRPDPDGAGLIKMPHIGNVIIEDGVEIGAGSCIDRAKFGSTVIGAGTKIDNLVQIGHNCRIGRCCVLAAHVAIAGSVVVEDGVMFGGQAGVSEHRRIGRGAKIGGQTGVTRDVKPGESMFGTPAEPAQQSLRQLAALRKLPGLIRRLHNERRDA